MRVAAPVRKASFCAGVKPFLSRMGVSIGPGLMVLTRMPRDFSSLAKVRPKERSAALVAP